MSEQSPDEVLAKWDAHEWTPSDVDLADALREAIKQRDLARAEIAQFSSECSHHRYTESPNGRVRQCRDCYKTATLELYGFDWT